MKTHFRSTVCYIGSKVMFNNTLPWEILFINQTFQFRSRRFYWFENKSLVVISLLFCVYSSKLKKKFILTMKNYHTNSLILKLHVFVYVCNLGMLKFLWEILNCFLILAKIHKKRYEIVNAFFLFSWASYSLYYFTAKTAQIFLNCHICSSWLL